MCYYTGQTICFRHLEHMALGVENIDDLDGVGEVLVGEVPDPRRAVAEDGMARCGGEAASPGLADDASGKRRRFGVGIACGDGRDGGVVGGRPWVAQGAALLVGGVGRPHHRELASRVWL